MLFRSAFRDAHASRSVPKLQAGPVFRNRKISARFEDPVFLAGSRLPLMDCSRRMSASPASSTSDRVLRLGAALGRVWKSYRRQLPPDIRQHFINLLTCVGEHVIPRAGDPAAASLQHARTEVREMVELLQRLAVRGPRDGGAREAGETVNEIGRAHV